MATPLIGTVIITGGNGALGSEVAVAIAKTQPFVHLLLLARDLHADGVENVSERIRLIGPRSFEIAKVDLTNFNSVITFALNTVERVRRKDIPPVIVLINSAAVSSYISDAPTQNGYDPVYQTNCLSPFLLTVSLLEAFRAGDGTLNCGARVINIGCSSISHGRLDYFDKKTISERDKPGTPLGAKEGKIRFGSSKLLMSAAMYGLRRSLVVKGNISLNIFTLDPGGLAGESHLSTTTPMSVKIARQTRSGLRPFLRLFSKSAINTTNVPAKVIARIAFQRHTAETWGIERYYILDNEYEAKSVIEVLRDGPQTEKLLRKIMRQVEIGMGAKTLKAPREKHGGHIHII